MFSGLIGFAFCIGNDAQQHLYAAGHVLVSGAGLAQRFRLGIEAGPAVVFQQGERAGLVEVGGGIAGIQAKGVAAGDLVNLASGLSTPLAQTPDAPTLKDLGVAFDADGYFMFIAPGNMAPDVRKALGDAIRDVLTDSSTEAYGFAQKAFGGASVLTGEELDAYMADSVDASKKLIKAVSN